MDRAKEYTTGVIVGRFQVDELTDGHIDLISRVAESHERTVIVLGLSQCKCTFNNPLDFQARKAMINERFPDIEVLYVHDVGSDVLWSDNLDTLLFKIGATVTHPRTVCLYGSRDSFIQYYNGVHDTCVLEQEVFTSGTARRKELASKVERTADFRKGVIWAVSNQYPAALATVDIAIFNEDKTKILLGRKEHEQKYRFIGGFTEPGETHDDSAVRETKEEAGINAHSLTYVKSFVIDDWRYRSERNKITTILFECSGWDGKPEPGDDIHELRWFPFNAHILDSVMKEHREMLEHLLK